MSLAGIQFTNGLFKKGIENAQKHNNNNRAQNIGVIY